MNLEQLQQLTDEELRVEMAKAAGFCTHPWESIQSHHWEDGDDGGTDWTCALCKKDPTSNPVPKFPTSRDAFNSALQTLTQDEKLKWYDQIGILIMNKINKEWWHFSWPELRDCCIAFLLIKYEPQSPP